MEDKLRYKLQLTVDTLGDVRKDGEQFLHETHYFPTMIDAFVALLELSPEQYDVELAKSRVKHERGYIKEAAIIEENNTDKIIVQVQRNGADTAADLGIQRQVDLYFPRAIADFETLAGVDLRECEGYNPQSVCLPFAYYNSQEKYMVHNKGLFQIMMQVVEQDRWMDAEMRSWNYVLHQHGKMNPDLLGDQDRREGWHFHKSWHYKELPYAFGQLLHTNLNTLDNYVAFYQFLEYNLNDVFIENRKGEKLVSLGSHCDFVPLSKAPEESGIYLEFSHKCPPLMHLSSTTQNALDVHNSPFQQMALYDINSRSFKATEHLQRYKNFFPPPSTDEGMQQSGYDLVMERISLAGQEHLKGFETLRSAHATFSSAFKQLASINSTLFNKSEAVAAGHVIVFQKATIIDSSGKSLVQRLAMQDGDLLKIDMSTVTTDILKSIRPYWKQIEQMTSPRFLVGRLCPKPVTTDGRISLKKSRVVAVHANTSSIRR